MRITCIRWFENIGNIYFRMVNDATVEKDESHPGKITLPCSVMWASMYLDFAAFIWLRRRFSTFSRTHVTFFCFICYTLTGKIAERRWYERNKHIFPASRWEVYDPRVNREQQGYTIHGGEVTKKD